MQDASLDQVVANSLDADTDLLPFLPQLLDGIWALGSLPSRIIELLAGTGLKPGTAKVLDLGCGKGATLIQIARQLGFFGVGIDAFQPFIDFAISKAAEEGVSDKCAFKCGDIRQAVETMNRFDVVIYSGIGPIWGKINNTIGVLRGCLQAGGYIIFDEGFLADDTTPLNEMYRDYENYAKTIQLLESFGDTIVAEFIQTPDETDRNNAQLFRSIQQNAQKIIVQYPEKQKMILEYITRQKHENAILGHHFIGATWLIRKKT